jgi:hypothetical protein
MKPNVKKILVALALLATVKAADAQIKTVADAKKAVEAAEAASQNPKKNVKANTWKKLGQSYVTAYDTPAGNIWIGMSKTELPLVMGNVKPSSSEEVTVAGAQMLKEVYQDKNLYFSAGGQLSIIEITAPVYPDALDKAYMAYAKAYSIDNKTGKDVSAAFESIAGKYTQEGYTYYQLGKMDLASSAFEKASKVSMSEPLAKLDTNAIYNAGLTAWMCKDLERAKGFFNTCYDNGYYAADGEIFSKLADVDSLNAKKYLEEGFEKFPQSQSILIGLINYYIKNKENPQKLFSLLDKAKANEPKNASLYYVEGNIHAQLGENEEAIAAYEKCAEIDPNYEYGYIGEGIMFYNKALDLQTKAQEELDDTKYQALVNEFEKQLKSCIAPFEKAFAITKDNTIKVSIAEYLKNAFYRFQDQDAAYKEGYEKYSAIVSSGQAN